MASTAKSAGECPPLVAGQSPFLMCGLIELAIDQVIAEKNSWLTTDDGTLLIAKEIVESGGWSQVNYFQFKIRSKEDWESQFSEPLFLFTGKIRVVLQNFCP